MELRNYFEEEPEEYKNIFNELDPLTLYNLLFKFIPPKIIIDLDKLCKEKQNEVKAITAFLIDIFSNSINDVTKLYDNLHGHINKYLIGVDYADMIKMGNERIEESKKKGKKAHKKLARKKHLFNKWHPKTLYNWLFKNIPPMIAKNFNQIPKVQQSDIKAITAYNMSILSYSRTEIKYNYKMYIRFIKWDVKDYFKKKKTVEVSIKRGKEKLLEIENENNNILEDLLKDLIKQMN